MKIPVLAAPTTALLLLTLVTPLAVTAHPYVPANALIGRDAEYPQGFRAGSLQTVQMRWGPSFDDGHHGHRRVIRIESAIYGSQFGTCNFTQQLSALADGQRSYRFSADNHWCGDPSKGNFKAARVRYYCGHRHPRQVEARAGQPAILSCD